MNFPSYDTEPPITLFEENQHVNFSRYDNISLHKLNGLFQNGSISADEHSYLVELLYPAQKRVSVFAITSLVMSITMWILLLSYNTGEKTYSLLSGESGIISTTILSLISIIFAFIAFKEISADNRVKGKELIAASSLLSGLVFVTLVIPYWIWLR